MIKWHVFFYGILNAYLNLRSSVLVDIVTSHKCSDDHDIHDEEDDEWNARIDHNWPERTEDDNLKLFPLAIKGAN